MNCVILQPSYIPWRGYFDQIQRADVFVFYDDVQYDRRGWRNRNQVLTAQGKKWLTIPVLSKGTQVNNTPINGIPIIWDNAWDKSHLGILKQAYAKAPYFNQYLPVLEQSFEQRYELLADLTIDLTIRLARELGIQHTQFIRSSTLSASGSKTDRLISILQQVGATHYISGPSAESYIEQDKFDAAGVTLEYMTYGYPLYPQLYEPFDGQVSVIDLLFMTGPQAPDYIWGCLDKTQKSEQSDE